MIIPALKQITNIIETKVDEFTDSMIEDIQDIIKVELDADDIHFEQGILPPRYKEIKEEMKEIIRAYVIQNMHADFIPTSRKHEEQHME